MKRILFVDNDEPLLETLIELSIERGYDAEGVIDAHQAVKRFQKNKYHAVIIDASEDVPAEGFALLSDWIKEKYPGVRRIVLTGQFIPKNEETIWDNYYVALSKLYVSEDISILYRCIEEK